MVKVFIHPSLKRFTNQQSEIELEITTVKDFYTQLKISFPNLSQGICRSTGELSPFVNLYINGKNHNTYAENTPILATDELHIVASLVGG